MKLNKLLLTAIPMVGVAAVTPAVLSSCSSSKTIELANGEFTKPKDPTQKTKAFGISGNFNKGTNYEFVAKLESWTTEYNKPTEDEWGNVVSFAFGIYKSDVSSFELSDTNKIKIICDNKELKQGTLEEIKAGTADWYLSEPTGTLPAYRFMIPQNTAKTLIQYKTVLKLQNLSFKENCENANIVFSTTTGK